MANGDLKERFIFSTLMTIFHSFASLFFNLNLREQSLLMRVSLGGSQSYFLLNFSHKSYFLLIFFQSYLIRLFWSGFFKNPMRECENKENSTRVLTQNIQSILNGLTR